MNEIEKSTRYVTGEVDDSNPAKFVRNYKNIIRELRRKHALQGIRAKSVCMNKYLMNK